MSIRKFLPPRTLANRTMPVNVSVNVFLALVQRYAEIEYSLENDHISTQTRAIMVSDLEAQAESLLWLIESGNFHCTYDDLMERIEGAKSVL